MCLSHTSYLLIFLLWAVYDICLPNLSISLKQAFIHMCHSLHVKWHSREKHFLLLFVYLYICLYNYLFIYCCGIVRFYKGMFLALHSLCHSPAFRNKPCFLQSHFQYHYTGIEMQIKVVVSLYMKLVYIVCLGRNTSDT